MFGLKGASYGEDKKPPYLLYTIGVMRMLNLGNIQQAKKFNGDTWKVITLKIHQCCDLYTGYGFYLVLPDTKSQKRGTMISQSGHKNTLNHMEMDNTMACL